MAICPKYWIGEDIFWIWTFLEGGIPMKPKFIDIENCPNRGAEPATGESLPWNFHWYILSTSPGRSSNTTNSPAQLKMSKIKFGKRLTSVAVSPPRFGNSGYFLLIKRLWWKPGTSPNRIVLPGRYQQKPMGREIWVLLGEKIILRIYLPIGLFSEYKPIG